MTIKTPLIATIITLVFIAFVVIAEEMRHNAPTSEPFRPLTLPPCTDTRPVAKRVTHCKCTPEPQPSISACACNDL